MATLGLGLVALLRPSRPFRRANKNSKAGRVPPSMDGDEYTLNLLEEDIVVHESWWCCGPGCGPQIAVEEDMVVKLGPLVAVVVVEAAACCLLPACPRVQGMRAQIAAYAWGGGPYVVAHPTGPLELQSI